LPIYQTIILQIDVAHPAAKSMIELARAQDEEVGDGTTSAHHILAGEILSVVEGFLEREIHPTVIVNAYVKALEEIVKITESIGVRISLRKQGMRFFLDTLFKF